MSDTAVEIASQPACWRQAAAIAPAFDSALPRRAERVAVIGCGTSLFMARAYAGLRESLNLGETDAFPASEMPLGRRYDRVLAISRSGTTTEVLDALDRLPQGMATVALTAASTSPLSAVAGSVLVLDFADERSVVQTRFATSALALLRAHLGQSLEPVAADAERALVQPLPEGSLERTQHTFLGRGWTVGLAEEAALKLLEAAGTWTESRSSDGISSWADQRERSEQCDLAAQPAAPRAADRDRAHWSGHGDEQPGPARDLGLGPASRGCLGRTAWPGPGSAPEPYSLGGA